MQVMGRVKEEKQNGTSGRREGGRDLLRQRDLVARHTVAICVHPSVQCF